MITGEPTESCVAGMAAQCYSVPGFECSKCL